MSITIRKAVTAEDRQRVFRFRYEIYVEEMKRPQTYADHEARSIEEPLDESGRIYTAEDDLGRVVGTVRSIGLPPVLRRGRSTHRHEPFSIRPEKFSKILSCSPISIVCPDEVEEFPHQNFKPPPVTNALKGVLLPKVMNVPASFSTMNVYHHPSTRLLSLAACMALAASASQSTAAPLPVSFHLSASPSAVALQFDIGFTIPGVSVGTPVLQGASPHQLDSQLQAGGKTRFVIYSSTNTAIAPTGAVEVALDLDLSTLQDGIMSVSGVVASNSSGTIVSASPGAKPVALNVSPPSLTKAVVGSNVPVGVELVDLDGSITSVLFRLNGTPIGSTSVRPFTATATSATPGNFAFTAFAQDNRGNSLVSPPASLQFIDPSALSTYSAFQATWLDGAGAFTADSFGTGIPNGLAWALGVNPRNPDRSRLPAHFVDQTVEGKILVYRARVLASGVVHQILVSTTLEANDWPAVPAGQITETLEAGGWKLIEARIPIAEAVPRRFVQLAVQQP